MKSTLIAFLLLSAAGNSFAQKDTILVTEPLDSIEVDNILFDGVEWDTAEPSEPEFPGGEQALFEFIYENFEANIPDSLMQEVIPHSLIYVRFTVLKDGCVSNYSCVRGHSLLCESAYEMLNKMPAWKPSFYKGEAVEIVYTIPIRVELR